MLTEPSIDKEHLRTELCHLYSVNVVDLTFVPKGEESWSYIIDCENGARYFAKIHAASPPSKEVLDFVWQLHRSCLISEVVCPVRTRHGEPLFLFDGYTTVLFEYISGRTLADRHPRDDQLFQLGELLARIHRCRIRGKCPSVERFAIPFQDEYDRVMGVAKSPGQNLQGHQGQVAELVQLAERKIDDLFDALRTEQQMLRERDLELVVCHGEPSPGNPLC